MIPSPLRDHLFVSVDVDKLDRTESGLYIPDWQPGDKDAQQAVVVAVPGSLSHVRLSFPDMDGRAYYFSDLRDRPRVGETVYLKPNTFKPDRELPGHPGVFLVPLDKVIAVGVKHLLGELVPVPFQGLLLTEPVYDDDVYEHSDGQHHRFMLTGISGALPNEDSPFGSSAYVITELNALPIPFVLRVLHTGVPLQGQPDLVKVGDVIVAHQKLFAWHAVKNKEGQQGSARWMRQGSAIVIQGREYCYIPRQCVMAKLQENGKQ